MVVEEVIVIFVEKYGEFICIKLCSMFKIMCLLCIFVFVIFIIFVGEGICWKWKCKCEECEIGRKFV